jgi:hypothetical protein
MFESGINIISYRPNNKNSNTKMSIGLKDIQSGKHKKRQPHQFFKLQSIKENQIIIFSKQKGTTLHE